MTDSGLGRVVLRERRLTELSQLSCRMFTAEFQYEGRRARLTARAVVMAFEGEYRPGSGGNPDAVFMEAMVRAGVAAWEPSVLVLDLRGMRYDGGDMIGRAWEAVPALPAAIAVSDLCRDAMISFVTEEMGEDPAAWLFPSPEEAVAAAIERFRSRHGRHAPPDDS